MKESMNLILVIGWIVDEWFPNPIIHGILQNPCNCKLGNHQLLLHIAYDFLAVLKRGDKFVHILEEECFRELIV
jgi:hypothetical protein